MIKVKRSQENPILVPNKENSWEAEAVFNGCVIKEGGVFHLVYRAMSSFRLSSIGCAESSDGIHFSNRRLLIKPEYKWERFGCEDPRVTKLDDKYFIFYTALSAYPPSPSDIKIGVAITKDFKKVEKKHQVTHFNSKAMALFPEKINGKIAVILTINTDKPPAKIGITFFDNEAQIWSKKYWDNWLPPLDKYTIPLQREANDHIEVGAPPIETKYGWLLIYSYIKNYLSPPRTFGIEAVLLDLENPLKIIGRTKNPLLVPKEEYELSGKVPNAIFPSGALIQDRKLSIYYGAADTTCCLAVVELKELIKEMVSKKQVIVLRNKVKGVKLERYNKNPIIQPKPEHSWESKATFNPAAVYEGGRVHIVYRAMNNKKTSVLGYVSSKDGFQIDERLVEPIYIPREDFEKKAQPGHSGCEDPRITKIGDRFYMCYTACDAKNPTRVALTSIKVEDFLNHRWNWEKPVLISSPGIDDKNACILPEKINGKYAIFHRIHPCIWIDFVDELSFGENKNLASPEPCFWRNNWIKGSAWFQPRIDKWDSRKIGIGAPPIKTKEGWLLIYHGLSEQDRKYRIGAMLLDLKNPTQVLYRPDYFILEPEEDYEKGEKNVVFPCGAVVIEDRLFVYYGAADQVVCVASTNLNKLIKKIRNETIERR